MSRPTVELTIATEWGIANFVRVAGWMFFGLRRLVDPDRSELSILTSKGPVHNFELVASGQADLGITTPFSYAGLARSGRPPFDAEHAVSEFGAIPHNDRLIAAVRGELGVSSFEEIAEKQLPVRIVVDEGDQVDDAMRYPIRSILDYYGLTDDAVRSWGGSFVDADYGPIEAAMAVANDKADLVIHEAMPMRMWDRIVSQGGRLISFPDDLLEHLESRGFTRATLPEGRFDGVDETIQCINWSDWLIFGRDDLDEELAYLVAKAMADNYPIFQGQYAHEQPKHRAFDPISVDVLFRQRSVPLHPGVQRFYDEWKQNPVEPPVFAPWPTEGKKG